MGRYVLQMSRDGLMGEGSSSVCRKGTDLQTGREVAVKIYKTRLSDPEHDRQLRHKFRRQIDVLQELMKPFERPPDETLWCERLSRTDPKDLFMELYDYSKIAGGQPGPHPSDGMMYVVTELAQCSLRDYIRERREGGNMMSQDTVRNITKAIMLVVAGLHAKEFVHLDIKPENCMIFDGVLKLIDVDGCVRIGSTATSSDDTLSFSPVYCAPEWASLFALRELAVTPALDVWSVGVTLCELVSYKPALAATFASFYSNGRSYQEAFFAYMDWLRAIEEPPIPKEIESFDAQLYQLLSENLLVLDPSQRGSLAESLHHIYVRAARVSSRKNTGPLKADVDSPKSFYLEAAARVPPPVEVYHGGEVIRTGVLWKLDLGGAEGDHPVDGIVEKDEVRWLQCTARLAKNGSLFLGAENKEESVLIEGAHLANAVISLFEYDASRPAFEILVMHEQGGDSVVESAEEQQTSGSACAREAKRTAPGCCLGSPIGNLLLRSFPRAGTPSHKGNDTVVDSEEEQQQQRRRRRRQQQQQQQRTGTTCAIGKRGGNTLFQSRSLTATSIRYLFGCESEVDRQAWMSAFDAAHRVTVKSMKLGADLSLSFEIWQSEASRCSEGWAPSLLNLAGVTPKDMEPSIPSDSEIWQDSRWTDKSGTPRLPPI